MSENHAVSALAGSFSIKAVNWNNWLMALLCLASSHALADYVRLADVDIEIPAPEGFDHATKELLGVADHRLADPVSAILLPLESIASLKESGSVNSDRHIYVQKTNDLMRAYPNAEDFYYLKADIEADVRPHFDEFAPRYSAMERRMQAGIVERHGDQAGFEFRQLEVSQPYLDTQDAIAFSTQIVFAFSGESGQFEEVALVSSTAFIRVKERVLNISVAGGASDIEWTRSTIAELVSSIRTANNTPQ